MNFHANHLIKLEPGYNAHITITNGQTTSSINPDEPTTEISGYNFTIKSDNDAMVYFFGMLPSSGVTQKKIENKKKISDQQLIKHRDSTKNSIISAGLEKRSSKQITLNNDVIVSGNELNPEKIYLKKKIIGKWSIR